MKNSFSIGKNKIFSKFTQNENKLDFSKTSDINVLLNRVKLNKKKESRKKLLFLATASLGVFLFGIVTF
tara:strand:- start:295 stop:501 length:207 start_codon:yes stop_codon:yes gene_type:complete